MEIWHSILIVRLELDKDILGVQICLLYLLMIW